MNATLTNFLNRNWKNTHEKKMDSILIQWQRNRENKCRIMMKHEDVLSYAFWYYVYNNDKLSKNECIEALKIESNVLMQRLYQAREHKNAIDSLYDEYLPFFDKSNRNAIWYLFWNDVWNNNGHNVKIISENSHIFNPNIHFQNELKQQKQLNGKAFNNNKCLALYYRNKNELIEILDELKLHGKKKCLRNGWFNDDIIDKLYQLLDWADENLDESKFDNMEDSKENERDENNRDIEQFIVKYKRASSLIRTVFNVTNQSDLIQRESVANIHRR